jgi:hypothetical protein
MAPSLSTAGGHSRESKRHALYGSDPRHDSLFLSSDREVEPLNQYHMLAEQEAAGSIPARRTIKTVQAGFEFALSRMPWSNLAPPARAASWSFTGVVGAVAGSAVLTVRIRSHLGDR